MLIDNAASPSAPNDRMQSRGAHRRPHLQSVSNLFLWIAAIRGIRLLNSLVTAAVILFSIWLNRRIAKRLLGTQWNRWYIRRTVDACILFTLFFMLCMSYGAGVTAFLSPVEVNPRLASIINVPYPPHVQQASENLASLIFAQFFIDNFFQWVVLPTFVAASTARLIEPFVLRRMGSTVKISKQCC